MTNPCRCASPPVNYCLERAKGWRRVSWGYTIAYWLASFAVGFCVVQTVIQPDLGWAAFNAALVLVNVGTVIFSRRGIRSAERRRKLWQRMAVAETDEELEAINKELFR